MADGSLRQFRVDLRKFAKSLDIKIETVMRRTALGIFSGVVKRTPVDTGTARASWQLSMDKVSDDVVTVPKGSKLSSTEATAMARRQLGRLKDVKAYDLIVISNNVPYIEVLEYGGYPDPPKRGTWDKKKKKYVIKTVRGFSEQAPHGMVSVTLSEEEVKMQATLRAM